MRIYVGKTRKWAAECPTMPYSELAVATGGNVQETLEEE